MPDNCTTHSARWPEAIGAAGSASTVASTSSGVRSPALGGPASRRGIAAWFGHEVAPARGGVPAQPTRVHIVPGRKPAWASLTNKLPSFFGRKRASALAF